MQNPKNVSVITLKSGNQIQVPPTIAEPAPEPIKLHSTPEIEDKIVAQKRKLPVATYPSARGRRVTCGCVFQERNMCGVATNVYLRKTSEKLEKTWSTNFK